MTLCRRARSWMTFFLLLCLGLLLSSCSSIKVKTDWDPEVDFSQFRTWDFGPTHVPTEADAQLVTDDLIDGRVRRALEHVLPEHGLDRVGNAPHVRVSFFLVVKDKVNVTTINNHYGYGSGWGTRYGYNSGWGYGPGGFGTQTVVDQYQQGTLVIDFAIDDAEGRKLVWRGAGSARMREGQRTPEESQARAIEAVNEILKKYPPPQS
jgi:hypothetical protein